MTNEQNVVAFSEAAVKVVRDLVSAAPELKITESESKTGYSFFSGKSRLCKVLKTKRGVTVELNVELPKKFAEMDGMETISAAKAKAKHLGTMKHYYRAADDKQIKVIITEAMKVMKVNLGIVTEEKPKRTTASTKKVDLEKAEAPKVEQAQ